MNYLEKFQPVVEQAIQDLGIDPKEARSPDPGKWYLHRGRAQVVILLRESPNYREELQPLVVAVSPLIELPKDPEKAARLREFVLDMAHSLIAETFSTSQGWLYLSASYYMEDNRQTDLLRLFDSLSYYAQVFVETLRREFSEN